MTLCSKASIGSGSEACAATIAFDTALELLKLTARPLGAETVPLEKAGSRVLAKPVVARLDAPRCDVAAMDGYAVRNADIAAGERRFFVTGSSYPGAGKPSPADLKTATRIMTGAPVPQGADRVIVLEQCRGEGGFVEFLGSLSGKRHVRLQGTDFTCGQTLLEQGAVIDPRAMVLAAASDTDRLTVIRRPRLSCIASGDELAAPGCASATVEAIPDSLSQAVLLLGKQYGAMTGDSRRVHDNVQAIEDAAKELLPQCDMLVMIGGASRGDRDFAQMGLEPLGLQVQFAGVAMKPGKPVWYGRIGGRHVLGLPGNPAAAMTVARLLLVPLLTGLAGRGVEAGLTGEWLPLAAPVAMGAREQFLCGGYRDNGYIGLAEHQSASRQLALASADILVRIPSGVGEAPAKTRLMTYRF